MNCFRASARDAESGARKIDEGWTVTVTRGARGQHLFMVRPLVDPPFASLPPLEVLDGVRQIHVLDVDAGFHERLAQEAAGRADEGFALTILDIPRLFADEHDAGVARTRAKHGLRGALPQIAPPAALGLALQAGESARTWSIVRDAAIRHRGFPTVRSKTSNVAVRSPSIDDELRAAAVRLSPLRVAWLGGRLVDVTAAIARTVMGLEILIFGMVLELAQDVRKLLGFIRGLVAQSLVRLGVVAAIGSALDVAPVVRILVPWFRILGLRCHLPLPAIVEGKGRAARPTGRRTTVKR